MIDLKKISFELILKRMLDRIPEEIDKREGSVIYDALAPCAMELMFAYMELNNINLETFGDTASREFLIRRAKERGVVPQPATNATLKAVSLPKSLDISIGARFSLDKLNYSIIEKITDGEYKVSCETKGVIGNRLFGDMIPIDYIQGLEKITLTEVLIPGEDEEDTEAFRMRYFESFDSKAYGGNVNDYLKKSNAIEGVGSTKVTPIWNGGGTVKLTILDAEYNKANPVLIKKVQDIFDPKQDGLGLGLALIGHVVTVDSVKEIKVNISTSITFESNNSFLTVKNKIINIISDYLLELRKNWDKNTILTVRIAQIEAKILSIDGVVDVTDTHINNLAGNLELTNYQIPIMGDLINE